ncbi:DUF177 domain-containing protein [Dissulfurirhabdus thermomarina]|uniref:DUF177 domain-containing protein n=1 Tax=Dissulfurirhabdus thermomarina TaxID=1765737 RepID=A0A6N9TMB0_DISTH|nr:DUF177 domain-containing protein [Dissulfurirhabdus thermomarina]NDY42178.1 DUF177 domain-containing protein [Dissulfurirhabdus thermomarina]NMX22518.1 DUF177 domain-containing protein [Dissulfurirhabdus thermomarina]
MADVPRFHALVAVDDIPEEGLHLAWDDMPGLLHGEERVAVRGPIAGEMDLDLVDGDVAVTGRVRAVLELVCGRCLAPYPFQVEAAFSCLLAPAGGPVAGGRARDVELVSDDMEFSEFDGVSVDAAGLFREQVLLQLPMRRLCREDCRGLCAGCGADLNREPCRCAPREPESPFAVLKGLRSESEEGN